MKRTLKALLSICLITPLALVGSVSALTGSDKNTTTSKPTSQKAELTSVSDVRVAANEDTAVKPETSTLQQRIDKRNAETKAKLTLADQKKVQGICKSAQGKVTSMQAKVTGIETSRTKVYNGLVSRLSDLSAKLKTKNTDTSQLDAEIGSLKGQIATFSSDLADYKTLIGDISIMDCVSNPGAFKSSVEAARVDREKLIAESQSVKTYVNDTIKPTLKVLRDSLSKTEGTN